MDPQVETTGVTQRPPLTVLPPGGGGAGLAVGADALPHHLHGARHWDRGLLRLEPPGEISESARDWTWQEALVEIHDGVVRVAGAHGDRAGHSGEELAVTGAEGFLSPEGQVQGSLHGVGGLHG